MDPIIRADIRGALSEYRSFLVCGHEDLDGDCIGSQLALFHWLNNEGKQVVVVSAGPTLANYSFLPGFDQIQPQAPNGFEVEVTICLDTSSAGRVSPGVRLQGLVINIDHHATNTQFGDVNWVDTAAAAVGEQIFTLFEGCDHPLTAEIATCLYVAILTDTGSFR